MDVQYEIYKFKIDHFYSLTLEICNLFSRYFISQSFLLYLSICLSEDSDHLSSVKATLIQKNLVSDSFCSLLPYKLYLNP